MIMKYGLMHKVMDSPSLLETATEPEILILRGFPPKIIWIRRGNCSTGEVEAILRSHLQDIQALNSDSALGILTLY